MLTIKYCTSFPTNREKIKRIKNGNTQMYWRKTETLEAWKTFEIEQPISVSVPVCIPFSVPICYVNNGESRSR